MAKSKVYSLSTSTNASVTLVNDTTTDSYVGPEGTTLTRSRTPRFKSLEVVNVDGLGVIYFRTDSTHPTVNGDNNFIVPAVEGAALTVPIEASTVVVRLITNAATQVAVTAK